MERDMFQRANRMQFRFGEGEERASVCGTFDLPKPKFGQRSSPPVTAKEYGTEGYGCIREGISGVTRPNGSMARFTPNPVLVGDALGGGAGADTTIKSGATGKAAGRSPARGK
jgi:hypothetical protein